MLTGSVLIAADTKNLKFIWLKFSRAYSRHRETIGREFSLVIFHDRHWPTCLHLFSLSIWSLNGTRSELRYVIRPRTPSWAKTTVGCVCVRGGGFREKKFWVSGGRRPRRRRRRSGQSVDPVIVIRDLRGGRAEQQKKGGEKIRTAQRLTSQSRRE